MCKTQWGSGSTSGGCSQEDAPDPGGARCAGHQNKSVTFSKFKKNTQKKPSSNRNNKADDSAKAVTVSHTAWTDAVRLTLCLRLSHWILKVLFLGVFVCNSVSSVCRDSEPKYKKNFIKRISRFQAAGEKDFRG